MAMGQGNSGGGSSLLKLMKFSDVAVAIIVLCVIVIIFVPMPPEILDFLLAINLCAAVITILISIYINNPLQFAVFPTMLLVATLFRLSLDISATRLILLHGNEKSAKGIPIGAGKLIPAFGKVVVGGSLVVGFIMFIILIVVQFLVITNGAERIAQVAARFTLDAMPGKQMAIDADLHSGLLDADSAKKKRREIQQEADFYGAMDGAGKFVKGDAMAAIVIVAVNIIGGIIMGVFSHKMSPGDALNTYAILTIGNGLVTSIPAFLMSTAMGIVVSRAASDANLGTDVVSQMIAQPMPLKITGVFMVLIGIFGLLTDTFPWFIFFGLAILTGGLGYMIEKQSKVAQETVTSVVASNEKKEAARKPESVTTLLNVDPISLEVGRGLLSMVDPQQGAKLLERVSSVRKHIALELGLIVPGVRFRDNLQLKPNAYVIKIKENEVARGEVMVNQYLAIGPEDKLNQLRGTKTVDPTFKLPGIWITPDQKRNAERVGCMLFDAITVIVTQLTEVIRKHGADLLGRQEIQALVDNLKKSHPVVVKELVPDMISLGEVREILKNLVKERVSIRDLVTILETMADNVLHTKDLEILTECVRVSLARSICKEYVNNEGNINAITLDPQVEQIISQSIQRTDSGSFLNLDPQLGQEILTSIGREVERLRTHGMQPLILTSPMIRPSLRKLTERSFPDLVILSWNEITANVNIKPIGMISIG